MIIDHFAYLLTLAAPNRGLRGSSPPNFSQAPKCTRRQFVAKMLQIASNCVSNPKSLSHLGWLGSVPGRTNRIMVANTCYALRAVARKKTDNKNDHDQKSTSNAWRYQPQQYYQASLVNRRQ